jgi:hypothetical protein
MSRSSLSHFPAAIFRAVAEHSPHANRFSFRVKRMVLILILRANSGANLNSLSPSIYLRRFRPLFATAQSMASSKLGNPLKRLRFLVLRQATGLSAPRHQGLPGRTAEIMTKACARGQSSVMLRSIRGS